MKLFFNAIHKLITSLSRKLANITTTDLCWIKKLKLRCFPFFLFPLYTSTPEEKNLRSTSILQDPIERYNVFEMTGRRPCVVAMFLDWWISSYQVMRPHSFAKAMLELLTCDIVLIMSDEAHLPVMINKQNFQY